MQSNYDLLGISTGASLAEIKAAYHLKLREFPAHKYPEKFKEIRAAYEALQKGGKNGQEDFFKLRPIEIELDAHLLQQLRERVTAQAQTGIDELIRLTY